MPAESRIETAAGFKRLVVDRDYADYKAKPVDLRAAYHLAVSLFHLRDWTFWEHSNAPGWPYPKKLGDYQNALEKVCADFGYIRDLANAVKHAELDPSKKPSTQMVGLANTSISSAAFDSSAFQSDAFQTRTYIVSMTAPSQHVDFEVAADKVMTMWNNVFKTNGWT